METDNFKTQPLSHLLRLETDVLQRVSLLIDNTIEGNTEVYSSPIVNEHTPESILSGLDDIINSNIDKLNEPLRQLESLNRSKSGPMSIAKTWEERRESLLESYDPQNTDKTFMPFILSNPGRLRPISVAQGIDLLKNDTNSGLPFMTKKKNVKQLMKGQTLTSLYTTLSDYFLNDDYAKYACLLFTRTQENGKTRNVWGYSIYLTLLEMCFYRPILDLQSKQFWRAALRRPDDVSEGVTRVIDYCLRNGYYILSIDFSAYDNSIKKNLSDSAFLSIMYCFQQKYQPYIALISKLFQQVPIVTPDGIFTGDHGVPSGSTFTNEVDSIVQFGIARECLDIPHHEICQIQGDDGVHACINPEAVKEHFRSYGLVVNDEKSYIAKDWAVYLQQLFHVDYRDSHGVINGIYPLYRALNRIIYLERFDDFKSDGIEGTDYFSIRTISILEQCKHHPLFREFVRYIWSLDKYRLKISDQGLANYVRRLAFKEGKDLTFREWTYGENISGLKSFDCVKIINELNAG